jgi:type IV fimbrial biogenesis protein FimT
MLTRIRTRGVTLIELAIAMTVMSIVLALSVPTLSTYLANQQIRTSAEKVLNALRQARHEAVKRNTTVQFSLVNSLKGECVLASSGPHIVVSRTSPVGQCDIAASDSVEPRIIQAISGQEGSQGTSISAHDGDGNARTTVTFNGLGLVVAADDSIRQIDLDLSTDAARRPLRVQILAGGDIRMCDPSVTASTDPRKC